MDLDLINDMEEVVEQQLGSHVEHLSNKKPSVKKVISHFEAMSDSGETSSANSMGRRKQIATKSSAGSKDAPKLRSSSKSPSDSFSDFLHQIGPNVLSTSNSPRDKVKIVKRRRRESRGPTTFTPIEQAVQVVLKQDLDDCKHRTEQVEFRLARLEENVTKGGDKIESSGNAFEDNVRRVVTHEMQGDLMRDMVRNALDDERRQRECDEFDETLSSRLNQQHSKQADDKLWDNIRRLLSKELLHDGDIVGQLRGIIQAEQLHGLDEIAIIDKVKNIAREEHANGLQRGVVDTHIRCLVSQSLAQGAGASTRDQHGIDHLTILEQVKRIVREENALLIKQQSFGERVMCLTSTMASRLDALENEMLRRTELDARLSAIDASLIARNNELVSLSAKMSTLDAQIRSMSLPGGGQHVHESKMTVVESSLNSQLESVRKQLETHTIDFQALSQMVKEKIPKHVSQDEFQRTLTSTNTTLEALQAKFRMHDQLPQSLDLLENKCRATEVQVSQLQSHLASSGELATTVERLQSRVKRLEAAPLAGVSGPPLPSSIDNIPAGVLPRLDEIEGQMNALQKHTDGSLFNIREEIRKEHALLANQIHEIPGRYVSSSMYASLVSDMDQFKGEVIRKKEHEVLQGTLASLRADLAGGVVPASDFKKLQLEVTRIVDDVVQKGVFQQYQHQVQATLASCVTESRLVEWGSSFQHTMETALVSKLQPAHAGEPGSSEPTGQVIQAQVQQATKAAFEAQANAAASKVNVEQAIRSSTEAQASATHAGRIYKQVMEVQTHVDEAREAVVLSEEQAREHARSASSASATAAQVLSTAREVEGSVVQHAHNAIQSAKAAANDACTASQLVTQVQEQCEGLSQQVEALCGGESDSDMPPLVSSAEDSDDDQRPNSQQGPAGQALKRRLRKWLQSTAVVATEANTQATAASQLASEAATKAQEAHNRAEQGAATAQEALNCAKDAHGHIHDMGQRLSDMSQDLQSTKDQSDRASQQCARVCDRVDKLRGDLEVVEVAMSFGSPKTTSCPPTVHDPYSAPQTDVNHSTPSSEAHGPGSLMGRGTMPT